MLYWKNNKFMRYILYIFRYYIKVTDLIIARILTIFLCFLLSFMIIKRLSWSKPNHPCPT